MDRRRQLRHEACVNPSHTRCTKVHGTTTDTGHFLHDNADDHSLTKSREEEHDKKSSCGTYQKSIDPGCGTTLTSQHHALDRTPLEEDRHVGIPATPPAEKIEQRFPSESGEKIESQDPSLEGDRSPVTSQSSSPSSCGITETLEREL